MDAYNYYEAVREDVKDYIESEIDIDEALKEAGSIDELKEELYDKLFIVDSVTGNGSGSYTFNTWKAEENLCHNMDLLQEALQDFGEEMNYLKNGAEACDVTIRCYLLYDAISEVVDDLAIKED